MRFERYCLATGGTRFFVTHRYDVLFRFPEKKKKTELKAHQHGWPPRSLDTCLSLRVRTDLSQKREEKSQERKKRYDAYKKLMKYASRKEKKRKKKMAELESQLKATEATENPDANLEWNTKTITQLFAIYFRILKKGRDTALLGPTLAGLSHFAHLINLDFFDDLLANLHSIIATHKGLTFENTLHCVHTTFSILSGQGSALNIDPMRFYGKLYRDLVGESTVLLRKDADLTASLLLKCVFKMIVARSKQVSMSRLLAFTKRLATLALHQEHASTIAMIAMVRKLLLCSPKTEILYDNEGTGSGVYQPEMEDPEYCKPEATALWELHKLRRHYHPVAASVAAKVLRHHPLQPEHKLTPELALKDPADILAMYSPHVAATNNNNHHSNRNSNNDNRSDHKNNSYENNNNNDNDNDNDFRPSLVPLPAHRLRGAFKKKKGKTAIFRVHRFADAAFGARLGTVLDHVTEEWDVGG